MQTNLKENSDFFERILQIIDYKGIKNVNIFATKYLNYEAPQKINRLKKKENNPSYEIIQDIVNKFEEIDANWLLTGKGKMLKSENVEKNISSGTDGKIEYSADYWRGKYDQLKEEHERILQELNDIKRHTNVS